MFYLRQSTNDQKWPVKLVDSIDGFTPEPSMVTPTITLSKVGGNYAGPNDGTWAEPNPGTYGMYTVQFDATDSDTLGSIVLHVEKAGCRNFEDEGFVLSSVVYDEIFANAGVLGTIATRLGVPVNLDGGGATIAANLAKFADDAGGANYDATIHSLWALASSVELVYVPIAGSAITTGTVSAGSWVSLGANDGVHWSIDDANGADTIDVTVEINVTANRIATSVLIDGYFNRSGGGGYVVEIYVRDYTTPGNSDWNKLSVGTPSTEMRDRPNDAIYEFALHPHNTCALTIGGDVKGDAQIRFISTRTVTAGGDVLNLDFVGISGASLGGATPSAIADAVWSYNVEDVRETTGEFAAGHMVKRAVMLGTTVAVSDTNLSFTLTDGITVADALLDMNIEIRDESSPTRDIIVRRITSWTAGRVAIVDKPFPFVPAVGDHVHILGLTYGSVSVAAMDVGLDFTDTQKAYGNANWSPNDDFTDTQKDYGNANWGVGWW